MPLPDLLNTNTNRVVLLAADVHAASDGILRQVAEAIEHDPPWAGKLPLPLPLALWQGKTWLRFLADRPENRLIGEGTEAARPLVQDVKAGRAVLILEPPSQTEFPTAVVPWLRELIDGEGHASPVVVVVGRRTHVADLVRIGFVYDEVWSCELCGQLPPDEEQPPGARPVWDLPPFRPFVGRSEDLVNLKNLLSRPTNGTPLVVALWGAPGVGKTALALHLAYDADVRAAFPGGVLWASLGPKPNHNAEIGRWVSLLGVDRPDRLNASLQGKRFLLILDDVWDREHWLGFPRGGTDSVVLVTTRLRSVTEQCTRLFPVNPLGKVDAEELWRQKAPPWVFQDRHREHSQKLFQLLQHHPLALVAAAAHLARWGSKDMNRRPQLLKRLCQPGMLLNLIAPPDPGVRCFNGCPRTLSAILRKSIDCLPPQTREHLRRLSLAAPPLAGFGRAFLQRVYAETEWDDPLEALIGDALLIEDERGFYRLPPLFAAGALSPKFGRPGRWLREVGFLFARSLAPAGAPELAYGLATDRRNALRAVLDFYFSPDSPAQPLLSINLLNISGESKKKLSEAKVKTIEQILEKGRPWIETLDPKVRNELLEALEKVGLSF